MERLYKLLYLTVITIIITLSFWCNSAVFLRFMDSDQAVHILMTQNFTFQNDLYYWGQNRLGSIIPLIANLFLKTGMTSIWAVSISQYLLLIITFYFISTLFKSKILKLSFAFLFFMPFGPFGTILTIGHPYIGNLFFISFPTYIVNRFINNEDFLLKKNNYLYIVFASFLTILSIWASEMSITFCFSIFLMVAYYFYPKIKLKTINNRDVNQIIAAIIGTIPGILLIIFAKIYSSNNFNISLVSIKNFFIIISTIVENIWIYLSFKNENGFLISLGTWLFILLGCYIIYLNEIIKILFSKNTLIKFILLNFVFSLSICCFSEWVFVNSIAVRYFSIVYFWGIILILINFQNFPKLKNILLPLLIFIISVLPFLINFSDIKNQSSQYQRLSEFKKLGKASILGSYWDAYLIGVSNTNDLLVTPFENETVRNYHQIKELFSNKNIYIVKNQNDTSNFQNTIDQFGYKLQKTGQVFDIAGYKISKYRNLGSYKGEVFKLNRFSSQINTRKIVDKNIFSDSAISTFSVPRKVGYFTFGPYINLHKGYYFVDWYIKTDSIINSNIFKVDVVANSGQQILAEQEIKGEQLNNKEYSKITLKFEVKDMIASGVEFRVFDYAKTSIYLCKVSLSKTR